MKYDYKVTYFKPDKQGISYVNNGYRFACAMNQAENIGLILYTPDGEIQRYPFSPKGKNGMIYGICLTGEGLNECLYNFYEGETVFTDSYATAVNGLEKWGAANEKSRITKGKIYNKEFKWQGDEVLMTPFEDTIIYGLNVRAFTMHKSSGVKYHGTFEGIVEKIPYLKELGITAIELMPCYEYEECLFPYQAKLTDTMQDSSWKCTQNEECKRLNLWGFQKGFYFAPKSSYSAIGDSSISMKNLVKNLHQNSIELYMQFYFSDDIRNVYILEVLEYWKKEYHIDGFRISGTNLPKTMLMEEPFLKDTKLWFSDCNEEDIVRYADARYKNIAVDQYGFRDEIRRFLKGDEGLINKALYYQKCNPPSNSVINFLADYDGYSLYDMVSYERKHNEANGEDGRDGTNLNYSWNCGIEGETKKKAILNLRKRQIKNALAFLFTSQGVPFLFSGDEFANTRNGNNNVYCQDNDSGWIKWKKNLFANEILDCTKQLITLRKEHRILHMPDELKVMDYQSLGYPDLSYHGTEAWRPDLGYTSRMLGIMLCGKYAIKSEDNSFYIAVNMHWEPHKIALPRLQKNDFWKKVFDSSDIKMQNQCDILQLNDTEGADDLVNVQPRSILIFESQKGKEITKKVKKQRKKTSATNESMETF